MNRSDFLQIIKDPSPLNRQMIGEIGELIELFPYFQSAHMLLLKGLNDTADVKFENQLRRSAIHIADREVLYYFLKAKPELNIESGTENPDTLMVESSGTDNQQTVIESGKSSDDLINELEKSSLVARQEAEAGPLQHDSGHSIFLSAELEDDDSENIMFITDEETEPAEENVIYMDPGFSVPERSDLLELETEEINVQKSDPDPVIPEDIIVEEKNNKKLQADLIDVFISSNPRIEPHREKSNLPVEDISKPFVEEQGGFVTETLAKIYISQGYYSKAIDIYEKLSLKFPEKSSYFAAQIEKVLELIKK